MARHGNPEVDMSKTKSNLSYFKLTDDVILVWSLLTQQPSGAIRVEVGDQSAEVLYGLNSIPQGELFYAVVSSEAFKKAASPSIGIYVNSKCIRQCDADYDNQSQPENFLALFSQLAPADQQKLFETLVIEAPSLFNLTTTPAFSAFIHPIAELVEADVFDAGNCHWLAPNVLYFDGIAEGTRPFGEPQILVINRSSVLVNRSRFVQLHDKYFGFVVVFPTDEFGGFETDTRVFWLADHHLASVKMPVPQLALGLEFVHYLSAQADYFVELVRNTICKALVDYCTPVLRLRYKELIRKLQHMVTLPVASCTDPSNPFNLHFDFAIPIGSEGVFVSGWMRDPLDLLETISMDTDFCTISEVQDRLHRTPREDISEAYRESPYGRCTGDAGIVAFIPLPAHMAAALADLATIGSVRFTAKLKNGVQYEIRPLVDRRDSFAARDFITKLIAGNLVQEKLLVECLGPAATVLHKQGIKDVAVARVHEFGKQTKSPKVSLAIPLYERLDYLKVQFAAFANDPDFAADTEVIYILDSPWQEHDACELISDLSFLYKLPVTLLIMNRNAGYAAATNAGVAHARGKHLLLVNSDVFPKHQRWVSQLLSFYVQRRTIGTLAPKLLFEDESLQHAGMFFNKARFPYWLNVHHYKGFPRNFDAALVSRAVPCVTGACLMISKELWERVGGLSTDYIVGDFEDSDLCLKVAEAGLESWYCADVELYHLERQSMPLNASYCEGIAWRYNAQVHTARWGSRISALMATHGEV